MDKRNFLKLMGKGAVTLAAGPTLLQNCSSPVAQNATHGKPKLWAWARPGLAKNTDEWTTILTRAREHDIRGLLLEVYNSSSAFFDTSRLPVKENLIENSEY